MSPFIEKLVEYYNKHSSFFNYILIGFCGLTVDTVFLFLVINNVSAPFGIPYTAYVVIVNAISMSLGIVTNFFLNAYLNFRQTDNLLVRLLSFYLVGLFGIFVSSIIIWLLHDLLKIELLPVKIISIVIVAVMQYFLNKTISFRVVK